MKVKIFKYNCDGEPWDTVTDVYFDDDNINHYYSDAELFEFDISESQILEKSREYLIDYKFFAEHERYNHKIKEAVLNLAHDYIKNSIYKGDLKEQMAKITKQAAIDDLVEDLIIKVEKGE